MNSRRILIAAGLALLITACTSFDPKTGRINETTFGEAKNMTMAAQIIDPDPQYEYLDPLTSGQHAAQAVERYRKDAVKKPERISSTRTVSGSN